MKHSFYKKSNAGLIIAITLVISAFFIFQMRQNTRMETDLDKYMPEEHPAFIYSDQAEAWFDIKDGILIAIENKNGIYNSVTLEKIKDISLQLQSMSEFESNDITSLFTADNIVGTDDGMDVNAFYKRVPKDSTSLNALQKSVRTNDMVYGRLVSTDETVALIAAGMRDSVFTQEFYEHILKFAHKFEDSENTIYVAGRPIVEGTMALLGPADMKRMVPIVLLVIALVLYLTLRSVRATAITLFVVFLSTIWAFGLMASLHIPVYAVSTMIPVMLIAIGVADGIHMFIHYKHYVTENPDSKRVTAVRELISSMWKPVVMTSVTTGIGFLSLISSQVYPIKYFGIFSAFGVMAAMFFSLTLLPAGILLFGYKAHGGKSTENGSPRKSEAITDWVLNHKKAALWGTTILLLISVWGIQKVWINSSFLDKFERNSDIVLTDTFINSHFGGTSTLNVILESHDTDVFKNPENLKLIDRIQEKTEALAKVGNSFSLADYLKRMNKVMNADDESHYIIPPNNETVAQYLLLYEMSGDPENLNKVVNYDYNRTNITFQLKGDDSKTINEALSVIQTFEDELNLANITLNYAGSGYKSLVFSDLILEGQIQSLVASLLIVIILLSFMFHSIWIGLIGSVPIIMTAAINFGIMGILDIPLSTTTALLSSIAIGIGIDYAIHFIQNYRNNYAANMDKTLAVYATVKQTGKAILFNAVVVIAGFMVLLFSVFPPNRTLGALVSMNMATSYIFTMSVMMILLFISNSFVHRFRKK